MAGRTQYLPGLTEPGPWLPSAQRGTSPRGPSCRAGMGSRWFRAVTCPWGCLRSCRLRGSCVPRLSPSLHPWGPPLPAGQSSAHGSGAVPAAAGPEEASWRLGCSAAPPPMDGLGQSASRSGWRWPIRSRRGRIAASPGAEGRGRGRAPVLLLAQVSSWCRPQQSGPR